MNSKSITIVSVTGSQSYAQGSVFSIERSYLALKDRLPNLKCLLISPEKPDYLPDYIHYLAVKPFGYMEYNLFMLYSLGEVIDTDFVLVVQNDGWVMNGANWRDEFLNYDYLGAPVPLLVEVEQNHLVRQHNMAFWMKHYQQIPPNMFEPQNGGFSLRSRRLLNAPRELGLKYEVNPPALQKGKPLALRWDLDNLAHHEDSFLSAIKRQQLEAYGLKFAPREIAAYFSIEFYLLHRCIGVPLNEVFGLHGGSEFTLTDKETVLLRKKAFNSLEEMKAHPLAQALWMGGHRIAVPDGMFGNM